MSEADRVAELEARVAELERGSGSTPARADLERLWSEVKQAQDIEVLLSRLKDEMQGRSRPDRAQVHGVMDQIMKGQGGDQFVATPALTIVVTSSEPCVIIVVTVVTLTVCD